MIDDRLQCCGLLWCVGHAHRATFRVVCGECHATPHERDLRPREGAKARREKKIARGGVSIRFRRVTGLSRPHRWSSMLLVQCYRAVCIDHT